MRAFSWWIVVWLCALVTAGAAEPTSRTGTNAPVRWPTVVRPPPIPLFPVAPVDQFRKLLAMSPEERAADLARRSPEKRAVLESKLQEFDQLSPAQREERLRALRLRVWLSHMIRVPSSNRVDHLATLPADDRQFLESRLREWDQMPSDLQNAVLENAWAIRILVRADPAVKTPDAVAGGAAGLDQKVVQWQSLAPEKRSEILDQFQRFFEELTEKERARVLQMAGAEERNQMEQTLKQFQQLTPEQKEACLTNLQRFAQLSSQERQQFVENAALWERMSPQERETWRRLVNRMMFRQALPPLPLPQIHPGHPTNQ